MTQPIGPAISAYENRAREFADAYESLGFEQVHEHILLIFAKLSDNQ